MNTAAASVLIFLLALACASAPAPRAQSEATAQTAAGSSTAAAAAGQSAATITRAPRHIFATATLVPQLDGGPALPRWTLAIDDGAETASAAAAFDGGSSSAADAGAASSADAGASVMPAPEPFSSHLARYLTIAVVGILAALVAAQAVRSLIAHFLPGA